MDITIFEKLPMFVIYLDFLSCDEDIGKYIIETYAYLRKKQVKNMSENEDCS